ncbi:PREDICTED: uncharacterized protein C8orf76 homolog [Elephantulus edwardii]|uniref:uncharacterized protein C8orf76 homolog n=1 Tax=Elephantulus edwardii TaxID=28737 RepID=UPI0003F0F18D|nr:PREDICTED: uncharacterized protein C8orf76 homolog [Elephantulus edwardii]
MLLSSTLPGLQVYRERACTLQEQRCHPKGCRLESTRSSASERSAIEKRLQPDGADHTSQHAARGRPKPRLFRVTPRVGAALGAPSALWSRGGPVMEADGDRWFGGEFEDSVFEEGRERRSRPPASYCAKRCEPQWFYEETESSDDAEGLTLKKFRGDLAYRRQEYQKALQEYSIISEKLSQTNFAMSRDVQEGQARCLARLGRHAEALQIAANLENKATNTDHLTTVLCLRLSVCSSLRNVQEVMFCLQKLICLHPFDPWIWGRLAEVYLNLGPALSASCAPSQKQSHFSSSDKTIRSSAPSSRKGGLLCFPETLPESSKFSVEASGNPSQQNERVLQNTENCVSETSEAVWTDTQIKACASFIRTRLLLQLIQSQQSSFALERNLRTQQEIEEKMKGFRFKEDTLLLISEVMGEDLVPEKIKEEVHAEVKCVGSAALAALMIASSEEFEDKWFRKIKDHFRPAENPFHTEIQTLA